MNYSFLSGRICTVPVVSILPLGEKEQIYVCKFVIGIPESLMHKKDNKKYNFFECIAFEHTAKMVNNHFFKGAKVLVYGKLVNHLFKDANNTSHVTNIILVQHVEFGDTESAINKMNLDLKLPDFSILSDLRQMEELFDKICKAGFLCIDENDYYNIASSNMDYVF